MAKRKSVTRSQNIMTFGRIGAMALYHADDTATVDVFEKNVGGRPGGRTIQAVGLESAGLVNSFANGLQKRLSGVVFPQAESYVANEETRTAVRGAIERTCASIAS